MTQFAVPDLSLQANKTCSSKAHQRVTKCVALGRNKLRNFDRDLRYVWISASIYMCIWNILAATSLFLYIIIILFLYIIIDFSFILHTWMHDKITAALSSYITITVPQLSPSSAFYVIRCHCFSSCSSISSCSPPRLSIFFSSVFSFIFSFPIPPEISFLFYYSLQFSFYFSYVTIVKFVLLSFRRLIFLPAVPFSSSFPSDVTHYFYIHSLITSTQSFELD